MVKCLVKECNANVNGESICSSCLERLNNILHVGGQNS